MSPLPKSTARKHTVFLLCLFSSLVVSFALFAYFMFLPLSQFTTRNHGHHGRPPKSGHGSHAPAHLAALEASSRVVEFVPHDEYRNLGHDHDALWQDDLLPPNGGYLTPAQNGTAGRVRLAMFHQLHCLAAIRSEMQHLQDGGPSSPSPSPSSSEGPVLRRRHRALACLDYLRQSLLCMADATTEPAPQSDEPDDDGMGERQCRDWNLLYQASARSDHEPVVTSSDLR
ncbi:uncharacterized protein MAM_08397 [Metarhizium album ARSEF 1941]|uniref:Tat pathway signal sequence n=1 Tax=Metarhizium album (strain ARSEF 1941) TaxID=1081103 RepID=A0A0B2WD76_METAS|nr:uncharacterized protein MAM_08397 [Metarhizium album ARSEF 1941]KHN93756.1 hypothetical protein MAM_08397 [Metarhizium album ARSEF 1941]